MKMTLVLGMLLFGATSYGSDTYTSEYWGKGDLGPGSSATHCQIAVVAVGHGPTTISFESKFRVCGEDGMHGGYTVEKTTFVIRGHELWNEGQSMRVGTFINDEVHIHYFEGHLEVSYDVKFLSNLTMNFSARFLGTYENGTTMIATEHAEGLQLD